MYHTNTFSRIKNQTYHFKCLISYKYLCALSSGCNDATQLEDSHSYKLQKVFLIINVEGIILYHNI